MTDRTDKWDESMCGIWRVKPEEKKMTEQERFEAWFSENYHTHNWQFLMVDGIYQDKHTETCWKAWQAAQQKEGYVLVPVEPTNAMLVAARDWSVKKYGQAVGNDGASGCYKAMIAAAQEPT